MDLFPVFVATKAAPEQFFLSQGLPSSQEWASLLCPTKSRDWSCSYCNLSAPPKLNKYFWAGTDIFEYVECVCWYKYAW